MCCTVTTGAGQPDPRGVQPPPRAASRWWPKGRQAGRPRSSVPCCCRCSPLRLGWGGDAEVRTLRSAHWQGGHVMPGGDQLLAVATSTSCCSNCWRARPPSSPVRPLPMPMPCGRWPTAACRRPPSCAPSSCCCCARPGCCPRSTSDAPACSRCPMPITSSDQAGLKLVSGGHGPPPLPTMPVGRELACRCGGRWPTPILGHAAAGRLGARGNALRQPLRTLLHYHRPSVRVFPDPPADAGCAASATGAA